MKIFTSSIAAFLACSISALAVEPMQAPEELSRARENILAGTVGKDSSPVSGVAQVTIDGETESEVGEEIGSEKKKVKKKKSAPKKPAYSYRQEKILNWIYETNDMIAKENNPQSHVRAVAFSGAKASDLNKTDSASKSGVVPTAAAPQYIAVSGYCTIPEEATVSAAGKGVLSAFCNTNRGKMKLFGELTPKVEDYSLSGTPIYLEDVYGRRYNVNQEKSYVLNSRKNSRNIATFVNTYALDKVLRESIKSSSKNVAASATQYMEAVKASRTSQETVMVPNAGTTTTTNTQKPKAADYVTILGIQMSADLVEKWADYAFQDHAWGFQILADTKIFIDLSVEGVK